MKIDRLIGILSVLLQKDKITAPELAERFEVSRRTINRDIEELCRAGIPIVTTQGSGGGISVMSGYKMDKTILSSKDMQMILAGLRSLDSVSGSSYYKQLMEKIKAGSSDYICGNDTILIDLSSWDKDILAPKIELIQDAIQSANTVCFHYYAPSGNTDREIEPYYLVYKWSGWYVYGFCLLRNDFRLFKLGRMSGVITGSRFNKRRNVPLPELNTEKVFPGNSFVRAIFSASMRWQLMESFGEDSFVERQDGSLLFEHSYSDDQGLISWLLSCRDNVTVLEPEHIRQELFRISAECSEKYKKEGRT